MSGETDLDRLIRSMKPMLNAGGYVFCTVDTLEQAAGLNPLGMFQEEEAVTVILLKTQADEASLPCSAPLAWITLTVHSSLEAVGLTAAVSKALTEADISCNVVAANYHDHIFVPLDDAGRAMEALERLSKEGST